MQYSTKFSSIFNIPKGPSGQTKTTRYSTTESTRPLTTTESQEPNYLTRYKSLKHKLSTREPTL